MKEIIVAAVIIILGALAICMLAPIAVQSGDDIYENMIKPHLTGEITYLRQRRDAAEELWALVERSALTKAEENVAACYGGLVKDKNICVMVLKPEQKAFCYSEKPECK